MIQTTLRMLTPLAHVCAAGNGKGKLERKSPPVYIPEWVILAAYYCTFLWLCTVIEGNQLLWLLKTQFSGII
jgi:hypothetical protein